MMTEDQRRPRLLVLASTFPTSAQDSTPAFVRDLAAGLSAHFDTTVLVPAVGSAALRERVAGMDVRRFRYFPKRWEDLADGAILENLRQRKSRLLQVIPFFVAEILAIRRAVRELQPDLLHVFWVIPQGISAMVGAGKRPMLVTTLGGDIYAAKGFLSRLIVRAVLVRAKAVTTMNEEMRRRIVELGADQARVRILPMGTDTDGIRDGVADIAQVPGRVLFVGRLVEKKGLAVLLDALRTLPTGSFHLRVVGSGPLVDQLKAAAQGMPVEFVGALSRSDLAREYAASSVVVFPSVPAASGDQDGLPVAMLEAMAAGRAVIASDLPGIDEAVTSGKTGLLVPQGNVAALAGAIGELLASPERIALLGQGATERANDYSVASIASRYTQLLDWIVTGAELAKLPQVEVGGN